MRPRRTACSPTTGTCALPEGACFTTFDCTGALPACDPDTKQCVGADHPSNIVRNGGFESWDLYDIPYEGEHEALPSWTAGTIPVMEHDELVLFHVVANSIVAVEGDGPAADRYAAYFDEDPARANIAEVAFGVNDRAEVTGSVLEDEKAGFHWAFGRSDHLGGVVGVDDFESPANVGHQDIVYARGNPIQAERAVVVHADGRQVVVIDGGEYTI